MQITLQRDDADQWTADQWTADIDGGIHWQCTVSVPTPLMNSISALATGVMMAGFGALLMAIAGAWWLIRHA